MLNKLLLNYDKPQLLKAEDKGILSIQIKILKENILYKSITTIYKKTILMLLIKITSN